MKDWERSIVILVIVAFLAMLGWKSISFIDAETAKAILNQILTVMIAAFGGYVIGKKSGQG